MNKNKILCSLCILLYVGIIVISCVFIILPGKNKLNELNNIKELTYDEKTKLIDKINNKYLNLEKTTIEKYAPSINDINTKYDSEKISINDKYARLEIEIQNKYDKEEKELNNKINDNKVLQNKEFFANGLSKKYYELSDKGTELFKEKTSLEQKEREEIRENQKNELNEITKIEANRSKELETIENNKKSELTRLNEKKINELNEINNRNINKNEMKTYAVRRIIVGIIIIFIPIIYVIFVFNKLTRLLNDVKENWSQVDIYLKQRIDLLPNIVETIKGYTNHEKNTLTKITKARNQVLNATTREEEIDANSKLESEVSRILALHEDYPDLKANENFLSLQDNLNKIEDNISIARQDYNNAVLKYKNKLEMFPSNVVACMFKFKPEIFFEITNAEKENIKIGFE